MTTTKQRPKETVRHTLPNEGLRRTRPRSTKKPHTLDNDGGPAKNLHLFEKTLDF